MLGCGMAVACVPLAQAQIAWRTDPQPQAMRMSARQIERTIDDLADGEHVRHAVVELTRPTTQEERDRLASLGIQPLRSLGGTAYLVAIQPSVNARAAAMDGLIGNVQELTPRRKMHPDLNAGKTAEWSVVESVEQIRAKAASQGLTEEEIDKLAASPVVAVYVVFHEDVDPLGAGFDAVTRHGGQVVSLVQSVNALVVHMSRGQIEALAAEDVVSWIEPPMPKFDTTNESCRAIMGVETVWAPPYGLDGSGVDVLVYDAGGVFVHNDLAGRVVSGDGASAITHATHVAGTIGGTGVASGGLHAGMAPGVRIISYDFEVPGGLQPGFLYTDPGDFEADYQQAITTHGADISNNSIGSNVESNGYDCTWQGDYGLMASLIDAGVRGSFGAPFRIVWAAGNERQGSRCDIEGYGDYYSIAPPGAAKNQIAVGALNSNDDSVTTFTSWGPTDDGRLKPDIAGPGCQSNGDGGVTSCSTSSTGYTVLCGTSMASPAVCGVSALLIQQWRLSNPGMPDMRNATLKAILANSAQDIVTPGPDYQSGYGSVRAQPAVDTIIENRVLEFEIAQGQTQFYTAVVQPGQSEFKITISWDDPPATPMTSNALINDVDLRVVGPDGTVYMPWTLDPSNPSAPAVQTVADHRNNTEQVAISAPAPGAYRIEIVGFNIAEGPTQVVGAACTNQMFTCSSAGIVGINGSRHACSSTLEINVIDCDLNTDDGIVDTAIVLVTSDSEPAGEFVTVTEIGPEVSVFHGSIPMSQTDAAGVLHISEGDTVTVTYIDADDGNGHTNVTVEANSTIDCTPPVLVATSTPNIEPRSADVSVTLNEPASVTVWYGTSPGSMNDSVSSSQNQTDHTLSISGLSDNQTYYYAVEMTDIAGNSSYDDNGGSAYSFTTPEVPDFFTEQFTSGSDLQGLMITLYPNTSAVDFYTSCAEPLPGGNLPTDPAGGTTLSLTDDSNVQVNITGGNAVPLYESAFTSFFVGSNGYITFGSGSSDYSETLEEHFSLPRISGWYDDLNPGSGGTVSYRQLSDRIAVTWLGVPEYATSNNNTFQIEMFFDGRIRISYASLDSTDGIAGISEGLGLDPDFFPSDLSSTDGCGPRPPSAGDVSVQTPVNTAVQAMLSVTDDGLPGGTLDIYVATLPSHGTIADGLSGTPITSVPFLLAGDVVSYTPAHNYQGPDSFTYYADDGGTPPEGGQSNTATVDVTVGGPQVIYQFLVDDTNPGWSTTGQWAFGQPTGGGSHNFDPSSGFTGSNVYGYNLAGDYPNNLAQEFLTTGPLDFTQATQVKLRFQKWLAIESSTWDHASVQVSNNGGATWTTIWDHTGGSVSPTSWTLEEYDISSLADGNVIQVRWVMGTTDGSVTYPGWNIDDIEFLGVLPIAGCDADFNNDGMLDFFDVQAFLEAFSVSDPSADFNHDSLFDFFDVQAFLQAFSAGCP
ncbi:MAG: hypothetical protein Kow0022_09160 [Phycisphaerales bacterium]